MGCPREPVCVYVRATTAAAAAAGVGRVSLSSIDTGLLYSKETVNVSGEIQKLAMILLSSSEDRLLPKLKAYPPGSVGRYPS